MPISYNRLFMNVCRLRLEIPGSLLPDATDGTTRKLGIQKAPIQGAPFVSDDPAETRVKAAEGMAAGEAATPRILLTGTDPGFSGDDLGLGQRDSPAGHPGLPPAREQNSF
jgi:hypothetical protein